VQRDGRVDARRLRQHALIARALTTAALASAFAACGGHPANGPGATSATSSPARAPLPFVEDDYPAALADARRTGRPIFVDAWAPWCHSCLSLRSFVLTDPLLAPLADRYVWLSIDTEKERNAAFVAKFTHESLPTLWVIRGDDESVLRKWSGTLTAQELRAMLEGGASAASAVASVHARVLAASKDDPAACARLGAHEGPSLPRGTPRADVLATALACAHEARLEAETLALLGLALEDARRADLLLADDRSALYEAVVSVMRDRRDPTEALPRERSSTRTGSRRTSPSGSPLARSRCSSRAHVTSPRTTTRMPVSHACISR